MRASIRSTESGAMPDTIAGSTPRGRLQAQERSIRRFALAIATGPPVLALGLFVPGAAHPEYVLVLALLLAAMLHGLVHVLSAPPGVRAGRDETGTFVAVARWRRTGFVLVVAVPGSVVIGGSPSFKDGGPLTTSIIVLAVTLGALYMSWAFSTRIRFSETGFAFERGPGRGRAGRWDAIARVDISLRGAELWDEKGRRYTFAARLLDGYPELAACLRDRLPSAVLDAAGNTRDVLEFQASRFEAAPSSAPT